MEETPKPEPTFEEIKAIVDRKRPQTIEKKTKPAPKPAPKPKPQRQNKTKATITTEDIPEEKQKEDNNILLEEIRKLNLIQSQILEHINKPKAKRIRKAPIPKKTLDLTITDNEIKTIIEEPIEKPKDAKLKAFLDALTGAKPR